MTIAESWTAIADAPGAAIASIFTLSILEIVLGIDNIIFISIIANKLPPEKQGRARGIGLAMALIMRVILLFCMTWLASLTDPLFSAFGISFTGRGLVLLTGGLFLLVKTTSEIHAKIEGKHEQGKTLKRVSFNAIVTQIVLIDIVFSFDSILTAIGMSRNILIMVFAVVAAMVIMLIFAGAVSRFINRHPTVKMLALAFLLMIGILLIMEGLGQEIDKTYIYVAMAFAFIVELLNMRMRKKERVKADEDEVEPTDLPTPGL